MTTQEELCEILDILHDFEVGGLGSDHPCLGCPDAMGDPELCRGCSDVYLCPGLQPIVREVTGEPGYLDLFRGLFPQGRGYRSR